MAARNSVERKRFVFRSSDKKRTAYLVTENGSTHRIPSKILPSQAFSPREVPPSTSAMEATLPQILANNNTPRVVATPARRVVVVRNTNNPQVKQGPVDLGNFGQPDSVKIPPVVTNGQRSIYLIRRPIAPPEPPKPVD